MASIIWTDVTGFAPEVSTVTVAAQTAILAHVNTALDPAYFGGEEHAALKFARILYAAHLGTTSKRGASGAVGPVVSESLGPASRQYGWTGAVSGSKDFDSTPYGRELRQLMRGSPYRGPFVA